MSDVRAGSSPPPPRVEPGPGQESVWDYPRPPRVEPSRRRVRVEFAGTLVAESDRALRVLETAGAPVYYVPPEDIRTDLFEPSHHETFCEWKGTATYHHLRSEEKLSRNAAWTYRSPLPGYEQLTGYVAFYPGRVDAAYLGDERVRPQPGRYYGGWITDDIVGPFKGEAGTEGW